MGNSYLLSVPILLICLTCQAAASSILSDTDWRPETALERMAGELEYRLTTEALPQQEMNRLQGDIAELLDAMLYIEFDRWLDGLPEEEADSAVSEQKDWLAMRQDSAEAAAAEFEGGTMAPFIFAGEFAVITKRRIADIRMKVVDNK